MGGGEHLETDFGVKREIIPGVFERSGKRPQVQLLGTGKRRSILRYVRWGFRSSDKASSRRLGSSDGYLLGAVVPSNNGFSGDHCYGAADRITSTSTPSM